MLASTTVPVDASARGIRYRAGGCALEDLDDVQNVYTNADISRRFSNLSKYLPPGLMTGQGEACIFVQNNQ